jgi:hypothetical protein
MMSSRTITVFSESADFQQAMSPLVASILAHGVASAIIGFAAMYSPRVIDSTQGQRYIVRHLELDPTESRARRAPGETSHDDQPSSAIARAALSEKMAAYLQEPALVRPAATGTQILIQPDRSDLEFHNEIQVPTLVMWRPGTIPVKTIVSPLPEELHAASVTPSISSPNEELALKNLALPSTNVPGRDYQPPAGTTSPLVVHKNDAMQKPPVSVSQASVKPALAPLLSVSDFWSQDKSVILPPISQSAGSQIQSKVSGDQARNPNLPGHDHLGENAGEALQGEDSGKNRPSAPGRQNGAASETDHSGTRLENNATLFAETQRSATIITVAKDGRFGAVVVGNSLEDRFPQIQSVWSGRLIYTVNLHVGLAQTWILQYSLPPLVDAAAAGNVARLEAPWPYSIVRPDLPPGSIDADALIVNGFINQDGAFEALKVILPASFQQAEFVLQCLYKWQFRPAAQGGHPTRVEVMLIIPGSQ